MEILLVEPSDGEALLINMALKNLGIEYHLTSINNGHNALDYLTRAETIQDVKIPDLILLAKGLNEKMNGFFLLSELKRKESLNNTAMVIITQYPEESDRFRAFQSGADGYYIKPDIDQYGVILKEIIEIARKKRS